jgi:hypothetical protein
VPATLIWLCKVHVAGAAPLRVGAWMICKLFKAFKKNQLWSRGFGLLNGLGLLVFF